MGAYVLSGGGGSGGEKEFYMMNHSTTHIHTHTHTHLYTEVVEHQFLEAFPLFIKCLGPPLQ